MTPPRRLARLTLWPIAAVVLAGLILGGCSMFGRGGGEPETTAATPAPGGKDEDIDIRRYLGPDYCPEIRVLSGAELVRRYERGHEDDPKYILWQASVGKTARECLFDLQGGLTLKIGVSGRVIAGPKGGPSTVSVPLKIVVVKFKEAVLATEIASVDATIPATGAATFTQVKDILVPSPGRDRDYIIYVGFDVGKWDPLTGEVVGVAAVEKPAPSLDFEPEPEPEPKPIPAAPKTPNVLPTPTDGFVLPQ